MKKKLFIIPAITLTLLIILLILVKNDVTLKADKAIMNFIYDIRGNKGNFCYYFFRILTEFGYFFLAIPICIIFLIVFKGNYKSLFIVGSTICGALLNVIFKKMVARERPLEEMRWMSETSTSFPSGHTATTFSLYLMIMLVLIHSIKNKKHRIIAIVVCSFILFIVPLSRLILAVHYPSDVFGGMLVGSTVVFSLYPVFLYFHEKNNSVNKEAMNN